MKNFMYMWLPSVMVLGIVGCSAISGGLPDRFDSSEFSELVRLNLISESTECSKEDIHEAYERSAFLSKYAEHTLNGNNAEIYHQIYDLVGELHDRESPSDAYCNLKWRNINDVTDRALEVSGSRRK